MGPSGPLSGLRCDTVLASGALKQLAVALPVRHGLHERVPWSPLASDQHVADRVRVRALVLRYHEDLSVDQIADVIGARPGTVRSLIHRGHESLRKELDHG